MIVAPKSYTQFSDEALMKIDESIKRQMRGEKQRAVASKEYKWIPSISPDEPAELSIVSERYNSLMVQLVQNSWELQARGYEFVSDN